MMERKDFTINSPYVEPQQYHRYNDETSRFEIIPERRPAGYFLAVPRSSRTIFKPLDNVNAIRKLVREWRENAYPHVTATTRRLLEHWHDNSARMYPFFWCQLEAIETLIFLEEGRANVQVDGDGGEFRRLCTKLCTGGGKTIVMSMLIAWQACSTNGTRNFLIVTPNLTVKDRLKVLLPGGAGNYYDTFSVVPPEMREMLNKARIEIHNWQEMKPDKPDTTSVDKRGPKSDNAFCRELVGSMRNIIVINDEAHHAWRVNPGRKKLTEDEKEATVWIQGLDRLHRTRGIRTCYDFSATPFVPGMSVKDEEGLFTWIVSDYSLSDGIEAGIVKTPRRVTGTNIPPDKKTFEPKLYHIYAEAEVKADLTRRGSREDDELPDLVRNAYAILAADWQKTLEAWREADVPALPVMISVTNSTETAARVSRMFSDGIAGVPGLCSDDAILHIDSGKLDKITGPEADELRKTADTVGKEGQPGEKKCNIISVSMLSEGWDTRTVTHIMGLRAFTSQLLCEQVVGRGLRRTSYDPPESEDGLFSPEYVNVFGVPFRSMFFGGDESTGENDPPVVEKPKSIVKVLPERSEYAITWPVVSRLEYVTRQKLSLDVGSVPELVLEAGSTILSADVAPVIDGQADLEKCSGIDLQRLGESVRLQRIIFDAAGKVYDEFSEQWQKKGVKLAHIGQVIRLTEEYLRGGAVRIQPELFGTDKLRRKIMLALNMKRIIRHIWGHIFSENVDEIIPVIEQGNRGRSTRDMSPWWTARPAYETMHSHISKCVCDSTWEHSEGWCLDHNPDVKAWAKNDHLGFSVSYMFGGKVHRYLPDFLVRLSNGRTLILEVKGRESEQDRVKREALADWVKAVNLVKVYGEWSCDVSRNPADVDGIIARKLGVS
ncbi:MAG: DEAD/DEAH box helicase family protein [Synergistaceae bacterium]|nr:DEAD/DEAH box helicase family protein [Synergistaceae bacterium]